MTFSTVRRTLYGLNIISLTGFSVFIAVCPRLCFTLSSSFLSRYMPTEPGPSLDKIDLYLLLFALCLMPLAVYEAWRTTRVLPILEHRPPQFDSDFPTVLMASPAIVLLTPAWLPPVAATFGPLAYVAACLCWSIGTLSVLSFILAAAQIDAESRGEKVRVWLLTVVHKLGGVLGVVIARRLFPNSRACERFPDGFPSTLVYLLLGAVFLVGSPNLFPLALPGGLFTGRADTISPEEQRMLGPVNGFTGPARRILPSGEAADERLGNSDPWAGLGPRR